MNSADTRGWVLQDRPQCDDDYALRLVARVFKYLVKQEDVTLYCWLGRGIHGTDFLLCVCAGCGHISVDLACKQELSASQQRLATPQQDLATSISSRDVYI